MTSLQDIDFSRNLLTGSIPTEIVNLENTLEFLYFSDNDLSGTVPTDLGLINDNSDSHPPSHLITAHPTLQQQSKTVHPPAMKRWQRQPDQLWQQQVVRFKMGSMPNHGERVWCVLPSPSSQGIRTRVPLATCSSPCHSLRHPIGDERAHTPDVLPNGVHIACPPGK